jgi:hypothetical protein
VCVCVYVSTFPTAICLEATFFPHEEFEIGEAKAWWPSVLLRGSCILNLTNRKANLSGKRQRETFRLVSGGNERTDIYRRFRKSDGDLRESIRIRVARAAEGGCTNLWISNPHHTLDGRGRVQPGKSYVTGQRFCIYLITPYLGTYSLPS